MELLRDLALPKSDRAVFIQWAIVASFWIAVFIAIRHRSRDARMFVYGVAMLNLAWFALRTVH